MQRGVQVPTKPLKPCNHRGCKELARQRFCAAHAKQNMNHYNRHRRDPQSGKRYGSNWKKIRASHLAANPLCESCKLLGRLTAATTVHHKRRLADGGTNEPANQQALCAPCHSSLHASDGDYF